MRPIKFRAWDRKNRKITYGEKIGLEGSVQVLWSLNKYFSIADELGFDLMQFTGLLDKNGKEIYEGDIMQYPSSGKIKGDGQWLDGAFRVNRFVKFDGYSEWLNKTYLNKYQKTHIVIGNIYENPDLIGSGAESAATA